MKLSTYNPTKGIKTLVYGAAKTGKTRLVGRLAQNYKLFYFDGEKGIKTLLNNENLAKEYLSNIELFDITDFRDVPAFIVTIDTILRQQTKQHAICDIHGVIDCPSCKKLDPEKQSWSTFSMADLINAEDKILVIDSLTQLSSSAMNLIIKGKADDYKPQFDDWGKLKIIMERILSAIQAANINIVCITHEELNEFEDGKKKITPVAGSSKTSITVAKYFDNVIYCDLLGKNHRQHSMTGAVMNTITGSRLNQDTDSKEAKELYSPLELIYTYQAKPVE